MDQHPLPEKDFRMIIRPVSLLVSALVCLVASAHASPITYDFSGTLAQPYKGSSLFSGSFSFDSSMAGFGGARLVSGYEGASASLTIGGQTYQFQNVLIDPYGNGHLQYPVGQAPNVWYQFDHNSNGTGDSFDLHANNGVNTGSVPLPAAAMTIHLADPTGTALLPSDLTLPSLDLDRFSVRQFGFSPSPYAPAMVGTITALQAVPEPSAFAFVLVAGLGLVVRKTPWRMARTAHAKHRVDSLPSD
jgi:hypothetical protein